jgi:asparagine synthase (glutamine-hydrolysing)
MCGIAGIISSNKINVSLPRLKQMTDIISHRGPDGEGHWISDDGVLGFGHRRLSIIDLSENGSQPMNYLDRYTIVYNGEIYNYLELKDILLKQGYTFYTSCDTEVLMAMYHRDKEKCLQYLDGMFAFAIYDKKDKSVFIARDRFGEKPFFYNYEQGKQFLFGSELKVLWAGGIEKKVNNRMLYKYLTQNVLENVNNPSETFYEECLRLQAGHYIKLNTANLTIEVERYYDIDYRHQDLHITGEEAAERFKDLFYTSVKRRLRSDVPVGTSLSGGLDSSAVVSVIDDLLKEGNQKQKTFSAVFPGFAKDESKFMQMVIDKTNVEPHFVTPTNEGMIGELDKLCFHQEEPFGSASIYVQYCVMKLARENGVTVLLDGQGADEILAGYHSYFACFHKELKSSKAKNAETEIAYYNKLRTENEKLHQVNRGIVGRVENISPKLVNTLRKTYHFIRKPDAQRLFTTDFIQEAKEKNYRNQNDFAGLNESLYFSTTRKGLHELLRYADRNSMAHSREVRLPFLNHDLVEFVFSLPAEYKIRNAWTKWVMRQAFSSLLPQGITWRKDKIGYEPPQKTWMENALFKQRVRTSQEQLVKEGIFKKEVLDKEVKAGGVGQTINSSWSHFAAGNLF